MSAKRLTISMPADDAEWLRETAKRHGLSVSRQMLFIIRSEQFAERAGMNARIKAPISYSAEPDRYTAKLIRIKYELAVAK